MRKERETLCIRWVRIPVVVKCIARLNPKGNADYPLQFLVVSIKSCPMLGLETSQRLSLIKRTWQISQLHSNFENISEKRSEVFGETRRFSGEHYINLTSDAIRIVQAPRNVPCLLKDKLKKELDRIKKNDITDQVDERTDVSKNCEYT